MANSPTSLNLPADQSLSSRLQLSAELAGFPIYLAPLQNAPLPPLCSQLLAGTEAKRCRDFHEDLARRGARSDKPVSARCPAGLTCFAARIAGQVVCGGHVQAPDQIARIPTVVQALHRLLATDEGSRTGSDLGPRLTELLSARLPLAEFLSRLADLVAEFLGCDAALVAFDEKDQTVPDWGSTWGVEPDLVPGVASLFKAARKVETSSSPLNSKQLRKLKVKDRWGPTCGLLLPLAPADGARGGLGFIALLWRRKSSFDPRDRERAESVRPELLLAVRTAALLEEDHRKNQALAASQRQLESSFAQVGAALTAALNMEELLRLILDLSVRLAGMDGGTIRLIEGQEATLEFSSLPSNNGKAYGTSLFLPICRHERIKASLKLVSQQRRCLEPEDVRVLEAFSAQAAMAIENAQIFEWEQQRAREATALYQAARTIEEGQELDEILEQSAEVLARVSEVDRCLILLKDSHRSFLTVAAATGLSPDQEQFFSAFRLHLSQLSAEIRQRLIEGRPLSFDSAPPDNSGLDRLCALLPTSSCLIVPLRSKERLLGLIYLDSSRGAHHFPPSTTRRVLTLSLQVANAIHRASLINQLQENLGPLKALYQVSTAITGTLSLPKVIRLIVDQAVELLEHSACALLVLDEIGESFRLETSVGVPDELLEPAMQAKLARTAVERKRAYSHYVDRAHSEEPVGEILCRNGFGGLLAVPLIARKKMVGVLNCFVKPDIRFRQQEIRLLRGFANQAAIAVENARLHGMIRFKMGELGTLFEVSKAVTSTLNLDRVLAEIVHHVRDILRADACSLMLLEGQHLLLRAAEGIHLDGARPIPLGKGVAGLAAKTGQPMVCYDREDERLGFPETLRREGLKTVLSVPIKARGRTIGLVNVYYREFTSHTPAQLNLLNALGSQAAAAIENARLYADKERVTELLRSALIPSDRLDFPGLTVGHRFIPSMDLSGDYYDLIELGPNKCAMVIADVSGKGPDAAIQTVRAKHVIKSYALAGYTPGEILRLLNEQVGVDGTRQVTVFYAEADLETRTLCFACAGHEPPIFWTEAGGDPQLLRADGILIGAVADASFQEEVLPLPEGSWLLLYTDGITEARSPGGEFFSLSRVLDTIREHTGHSAQRLVNRIYTRVRKFTRERITDDFSLMAVRF